MSQQSSQTGSARDLMLQARDFIAEKRYPEAHNILIGIDHPQAHEWLLKLDEIELGNPFSGEPKISQRAWEPGTTNAALAAHRRAKQVKAPHSVSGEDEDLAWGAKAVVIVMLFVVLGLGIALFLPSAMVPWALLGLGLLAVLTVVLALILY